MNVQGIAVPGMSPTEQRKALPPPRTWAWHSPLQPSHLMLLLQAAAGPPAALPAPPAEQSASPWTRAVLACAAAPDRMLHRAPRCWHCCWRAAAAAAAWGAAAAAGLAAAGQSNAGASQGPEPLRAGLRVLAGPAGARGDGRCRHSRLAAGGADHTVAMHLVLRFLHCLFTRAVRWAGRVY